MCRWVQGLSLCAYNSLETEGNKAEAAELRKGSMGTEWALNGFIQTVDLKYEERLEKDEGKGIKRLVPVVMCVLDRLRQRNETGEREPEAGICLVITVVIW